MEYVEAVADIVNAVNSVPAINGDLLIPVGSYTIVEPDGNGGTQPVDLRQEGDLSGASPNITQVVDPVTELQTADPEASGLLRRAQSDGHHHSVHRRPVDDLSG